MKIKFAEWRPGKGEKVSYSRRKLTWRIRLKIKLVMLKVRIKNWLGWKL